MRTVASFDSYGTTFYFEPPVTISDESICTLGDIAAAAVGFSAVARASYAAAVDGTIRAAANGIAHATGRLAAPEQIANLVQTAMHNKHTVRAVH